MADLTNVWNTEVEGTFGGEDVLFHGKITEWTSNDALGIRQNYYVQVHYSRVNSTAYNMNPLFNYVNVHNNFYYDSLDAAKRKFKNDVNGNLKERVKWVKKVREV